jgi:TolA-binding protein
MSVRQMTVLKMILIGCVIAPNAHAQRKGFVPKADGSATIKKRQRKALPKGPGFKQAERSKDKTKAMAKETRRRQFELLQKMIKTTPKSHPRRPELLYRMAGMFWEQAIDAQNEAMNREQSCMKRAKSTTSMQRCESGLERDLEASKKYRTQAIGVYTYIVKNHADFKRLDEVLLQLGINYLAKEQPNDATQVFRAIISRYPRSRVIPEVLLKLGEIYFEQGKVNDAAAFYQRITEAYANSSNFAYAKYKLGWCRFNQQDYRGALRHFIGVLSHSRKARNSGRREISLEKEVLGDIVRTYVYLDRVSAKKTLAYFKKIAPDRYMDLTEKLAQMYADAGKFAASNRLYRVLIAEEQRSYRVVGYQRAIAENVASMGSPGKAVTSLTRLVDLWSKRKGASDADPKRVEKDRIGIENMLRSMAVTYHRQASRTRSKGDYATAYTLYTTYLKAFKGGQHEYTMTYYFAELVNQLKRWREAAIAFVQVAEMKPDGDYARDAAHGAVLAFKKLLDLNRTKSSKSVVADVEAEIPKSRPLSQDHALFIKACDLYKRYASRKDPYRIDIEYQAALVYYDHAQYSDAVSRFRLIAEKRPTHRLAPFAADFLLDSFILQKDYKALNSSVDRLLGLYKQSVSPSLYGRLVALKQKSEFNNCRALEREDRTRAAECFVRYADAFSSAELADDALFNAAFNFKKDRETTRSSQTLMRLVAEYEASSLRNKSMFQLAVNFKTLAIFSLSSKYFEDYAKAFPEDEKSNEALRTAAVFQEGLGKYDRAISIYLDLVKRLEKKRKKGAKRKAAERFFEIGRIYEDQKSWVKMIQHYTQFLRKYQRSADVELVIRAYAKIGSGHWAQADAIFADYARRNQKGDKPIEHIRSKNFWGRFNKTAKRSKAAYKTAYDKFASARKRKKLKKTSKRLLDAVAESRFRVGEVLFFDFYHGSRLQAKTFKNPKKFAKRMTSEIKKRGGSVLAIKKVYDEVLTMGSATWSIAALTRSGQMRALLAKEIDKYPAPKLFTEDMKDEFCLNMANLSEPQRKLAVTSFRLCLDKARELRWFNKWSDLADRALAELDPANYRYSDEIRIAPDTFGAVSIKPTLVEKMRVVE